MVGLTVAVAPAGKPLFQVTVPAQFVTVNVALEPAQIAVLFTVGVGFGLMISFTVVFVDDLQLVVVL